MTIYVPEAYQVTNLQVYACKEEDVFHPDYGVILRKFDACNKMEPGWKWFAIKELREDLEIVLGGDSKKVGSLIHNGFKHAGA